MNKKLLIITLAGVFAFGTAAQTQVFGMSGDNNVSRELIAATSTPGDHTEKGEHDKGELKGEHDKGEHKGDFKGEHKGELKGEHDKGEHKGDKKDELKK